MAFSRYFIELSYDGTRYFGWQVQENAVTIQEEIEKAIRMQTGDESIKLTGCGRTDTGVHARKYFAHFDIPGQLEGKALEQLHFKLNSQLPGDISIHRIFAVINEAHARFSAISRTYSYYIHTLKDPFLNSFSWYLYGDLDVDKMNEGAALLINCDDFTSFARAHTQTRTNICRVTRAEWRREGHQLIFTITADRFLRNMVRAIVGTLVDLGRSRIDLSQLPQIIEGKDRSLAGQSAPAIGLFLENVEYQKGIVPA